MKSPLPVLLLSLIFVMPCTCLFAQKNRQVLKQEQCATMNNLESKLSKSVIIKNNYLQQLSSFNKIMEQKRLSKERGERVAATEGVTYTIPVVFHIVLKDPSVVTDAQILKQLNILNEDFAATDPDSSLIPAYFKPLHGKSNIQFCLAQQTPSGESTTGIERTVTNKDLFLANDNGVKHTASGGVDLWDETKYYNVWVCVLGNSILGYATFPTDGETTEQGVAIHYQSLPGGIYNNYNGGKTLTHETGHYFNLYHIWGDDDGACTGTDYIDDTPNQANFTTGCYNGIHTDSCTPTGNGVLYQNYMDYSNDQCLLLFTPEQDDRMQTALLTYRSSLLTSHGCVPPVLYAVNAQLKAIVSPGTRLCNPNISPVVTVRNMGAQTLTSFMVTVVADNAAPVNINWTGSLVSLDQVTINLATININPGSPLLKFYVSNPNNTTDQDNSNDTLTTTVQYYAPVKTIAEGFEAASFTPAGWDIINPDNYITWKKVNTAAYSGTASVMIDNFNYTSLGQQDYLRLPQANLAGVDSAFFTFEIAAAAYTPLSNINNIFDTLEVLLSTDCGLSYTSLYKKGGGTLVTQNAATTSFFVPTANQWRKDSINLSAYINSGNILLAFRNTTANENNIYLDDINLRTITINPNLKKAGYLVTPNPAKNNIQIQFYPNPSNLRGISLYNLTGQKLAEIIVSGPGEVVYNMDISSYPAGMYIVRAVFTDKVLIEKIIKN